MGVRGLEQMVDNRMNHAPRLASVQATKKASSTFQSSWIRRVTGYCLSSAVVQRTALQPRRRGRPSCDLLIRPRAVVGCKRLLGRLLAGALAWGAGSALFVT